MTTRDIQKLKKAAILIHQIKKKLAVFSQYIDGEISLFRVFVHVDNTNDYSYHRFHSYE